VEGSDPGPIYRITVDEFAWKELGKVSKTSVRMSGFRSKSLFCEAELEVAL
jgi:hypothetical protein